MVAELNVVSIHPAALRRDLDLSRERMGRLVDVSAKTIERWEDKATLPSATRDRQLLSKIQTVRDLGLMVYTLEGFRLFMRSPLPTLNNLTPLQLIEQGRIDDVIAALASDYEGLGY